MEDEAIRELLTRLARPHRSGGQVIERAAVYASGTGSADVFAWITAHGGTAEAVASTSGRGIHDRQADAHPGTTAPTPLRFVLPADALSR